MKSVLRLPAAAAVVICAFSADAFVTPFSSATSQSHSAVSPTTATSLFTSPEPLAEEVQWQAFLDDQTTGLVYYFNTQTGDSLWEPPTSTFPSVKLPRKQQRLADDLRRQYRRQRQAAEEQATEVVEEEIQEEQSNWIDGLGVFDKKKEAETTEPAPVEVQEPQDDGSASNDIFGNLFKAKKEEQAAIEEPTEQVQEQSKLEDSMFGNFFKPKSAAEATEEPAVKQEQKEEDAPAKRSLFGGFMGASPSAAVETVEEEVAPAPAPAPAPQKQQKPQVIEKKIEVVEQPPQPKPIKIEMASYVSPHPAKVRWGGEDAVFTKGRTFGVFDGVSGAEKLDGVPLYSKTLAQEMTRMVGKDSISIAEMTLFLSEAANYADSCATGASTAVVASISETGILQALNIGDSYCMVIRDGRITAKTREISHYWECPYQLSEDSPDRPKDGTKLNVELMPGDLVLMGSDGIFDNMDDDMLVETIEKGPKKASAIARRIVDLSRKLSLDSESETPYAKMAKRRGDPDYKTGLGGKVDDSSAVVVICK